MRGRREDAREDDDVETGHGAVTSLRGENRVGLAAHDRRVELRVEGGKVDGRIHHDPIVVTVRPGDEAVQAHRHLVAQSSAHHPTFTMKLSPATYSKVCANVSRLRSGSRMLNSRSPHGWLTGSA